MKQLANKQLGLPPLRDLFERDRTCVSEQQRVMYDNRFRAVLVAAFLTDTYIDSTELMGCKYGTFIASCSSVKIVRQLRSWPLNSKTNNCFRTVACDPSNIALT